MRTWPARINSFFGLMLVCSSLSLAARAADDEAFKPESGGKTNHVAKVDKSEKDESKQSSTIRLHMETTADSGASSGKIKLMKNSPQPVVLTVEKDAFTDEGFLENARLLDTVGGPMIALKFDTRGALRMQMWTVSKPGRRIAVWARWTDGRWLAAPMTVRAIEDGVLVFSPDATREECERIVRGLNNVAIKLGNQKKPEKPKKPSVAGKPADKGKTDAATKDESVFEK